MYKTLNNKEWDRLSNEYEKITYKCECGHSVVIPYHVEKQLCGWCHKYVFKNKQDEFKYRLIERKLRNEK